MKEKIKKLPMQNWYIKEKATLVEALFNKVNELVTAHNDTVLKEERKIGGHTYSKSGKDMCCQPLTEGEYGKPDFIGKDDLGALEQVHKDMSEGEGEDLEVEEDTANLKIIKKTLEEGIKIVSDARKEVHEKYPHLFEDKPVQKLPSERIGEIVKQFKTDGAPTDDAILVAIIQYLDEQSKK